jgi:hypothetical protein
MIEAFLKMIQLHYHVSFFAGKDYYENEKQLPINQ